MDDFVENISFISFVLIVFFFYFLYNKRKKRTIQKDYLTTITTIKRDWNKIQINTSHCDVLKYDYLIDKREIKENENILNWFLRVRDSDYRKEPILNKASKIICYLKSEEGEIVDTFEDVVEKDISRIEFKLRMRDYIDIYIDNKVYSISENNNKVLSRYFIDLDFLDTEITSL